ncbi:antibiotic resistance protein VanZ [Halostella sp. JP-L12]|uniref:VanZ family protein n=1 Tax=Halostella TaxID=1843185 RepID=UPI000EF7A4AE|nr:MULTISPECIES: VanZ family protein [Halostella]NHN46908.1 antibiotic resistance protein VanZ [Halostella sp. JP-L12]
MHRRWLPALAVAVALLVASAVPPGPAGGAAGPLPLDKLLHGAGYAALAGTLVVGLTAHRRSTKWAAGLSVCGATSYGLAIELLQAGIPYRAFSLADAGANALGAVLGAAVVVGYRRRMGR